MSLRAIPRRLREERSAVYRRGLVWRVAGLAATLLAIMPGCTTNEPRDAPLAEELSTSQQVTNVAGAPFRWVGAALFYPLKGLFYDLPVAIGRPSDLVRDRTRAVDRLASPMPAERAQAALHLGELATNPNGVSRSVDADLVYALLDDPASPVRSAAALALGTMRDPRAFASLASRLKDPDPALRGGCAIALGRLGDPRAGPLVRDLAASPWGEHWYVQLAAIQAGSVLGVKEVGVHAQRMLGDPPPEAGWLAPATALVALGRLHDREARPAIAAHLGSAHPAEVRTAAALALAYLGDRDLLVQGLAAGRSGDELLPFVLVLERLRHPGAGEALARLLGHPDPRVRAHAAGALIELRDERGVDGLLEGVQSPSVYERFYCLGRLERISGGNPSAGFSEKAWREWWREDGGAILARWAEDGSDPVH